MNMPCDAKPRHLKTIFTFLQMSLLPLLLMNEPQKQTFIQAGLTGNVVNASQPQLRSNKEVVVPGTAER